MQTQLYSGIVINQNQPPSSPSDYLQIQSTATTLYPEPTLYPGPTVYPTPLGGQQYFQNFALPNDYARGGQYVAPLTGFQMFCNVSAPSSATIAWEIARLGASGSWVVLDSGTTVGTAQAGQTWFTVYFNNPLQPDAQWTTDQYRIGISTANGLTGIYYSPNTASGRAYQADGQTPVTNAQGNQVALMFRVLGAIADSGTDFLGNVYRSVVTANEATNVNVLGTSDQESYWLSAPCPSQFGVTSLYFDERDSAGNGAVIDRLTIDPITPGVYFNIYYSNDVKGPGTDPASWANLLWTPVYERFQLNRRQTYALPSPIFAKYVKIEFTQLQARPYTPGTFDKPSNFNKYPQWVLDYFVARFVAQSLDLNVDQIAVTYDALDLAFSYYSDDIVQNPAAPALSTSQATPNISYLNSPTSTTNSIDPNTLAQIDYAFQPFLQQPAVMGTLSSLIGQYTSSVATSNYSTESIATAVADTSVVSNLEREPLLVEKGFPVMFFFVPCRHTYRVSQAAFTNGVAYYAGVTEVTFHRDVYSQAADTSQYNEPMNDTQNGSWSGTLLPLAPGT